MPIDLQSIKSFADDVIDSCDSVGHETASYKYQQAMQAIVAAIEQNSDEPLNDWAVTHAHLGQS